MFDLLSSKKRIDDYLAIDFNGNRALDSFQFLSRMNKVVDKQDETMLIQHEILV